MLRARVAFVLGLLMSAACVTALVYLNAPKYFLQVKSPGLLELLSSSDDCKVTLSDVEILGSKTLEHRTIRVSFDHVDFNQECVRFIQHNQPMNEEFLQGAELHCIFSTEPTGLRDPPELITKIQQRPPKGPLSESCVRIMEFDVAVHLEGYADQRIDLKLLGADTDALRKSITIYTGDSLSSTVVPDGSGRGLRLNIKDGDRASLLTVLNILLSTLVGVGISAMFEAVLAMTMVSMINESRGRKI